MRALPLMLTLLSAQALAADAGAPAACSSAEHRQFDFWLGNWSVTLPDGKAAGTNRITQELGSCVLHEHWAGRGGNVGESFNIYDAVSKRWHQTWVDNQGMLLVLEGGLVNGAMVLTGSAAGSKTVNRITWQSLPKAQVRQLWETSSDGGKTWKTEFDGLYQRA